MKNKDRLRNYLRYHHFNTMPVRKSHSKFIQILGEIEEVGGCVLGEAASLESGWQEIKAAMQKMTDEQAKYIRTRIIRLKEKIA